MQQCISSERITGSSDVRKAHRSIASTTWWKKICDVIVRPCSTTGSPLSPPGPSQQSISRQRQPLSSWTSYMRGSELERHWSPVRYELCDVAMK